MIHLVLCWHFHQPDYRTEEGRYFLPWTYLHAIKDYADMAAHLEAQPGMRAVVNFVPTLLEQLDDYVEQFRSGTIRDPLLAALIEPDLSRYPLAERRALIEACFKLNFPTMLDPFPGYRRLSRLWQAAFEDGDAAVDYFSNQYLGDLVTWYHLAWTGETVRREHGWLVELMQKGSGFDMEERGRLYRLIGEVIADLVPRFDVLGERGQIELSATPHSHPIAPLLLDFQSAREARPGLHLPASAGYPGGRLRVKAHIEAAMGVHESHFGRRPAGLWPAEGSISTATLDLFSKAGVRWAASGEGVLRHSLHHAGLDASHPYPWLSRPCRLTGQKTVTFFRDDHLSDLIGFEYKGWFAQDAVRHFLRTLEDRYRAVEQPDPVVTVVLDGENAWEYYPYNGWYFLSELYQALVEHPSVRVTTFSEYLDLYPKNVKVLPTLTAGSWVYGDFTTWMGDPAKNRAWDLLCAAKAVYDQHVKELRPARRREAELQLRSCESSDWFWWFGDYNPGDSVAAFDKLYRAKLRRLYQLLEQPVPASLTLSLSRGGGPAESGGVMRRGGHG
ncbi:glycoside hydrolase family 57 protein [Parasulfuritortus cantonensis]|uniref:glycoside hydrolase family 57 protein n=1 Tax=Parasulfuritortus cantonensis TaxID=2528202 RepID=UPI001F0EE262|nr:glycoside hydrolase family 57 protein [Parasulfuritortus cantonensis]